MGRLWARKILYCMPCVDLREYHYCPQHMGNLEITQPVRFTPKLCKMNHPLTALDYSGKFANC